MLQKNKEIIPNDWAAGEKIFEELKFGNKRSKTTVYAIDVLYSFFKILKIIRLNKK